MMRSMRWTITMTLIITTVMIFWLMNRMSSCYQRLEVLMHLPMFINYILYGSPGLLIFLQRPFNEYIPKSCVWNLFLGYLYSGTTLQLQWSYCFSSFSNYETNTFIWYWNNISLINITIVRRISYIRTWWTIRSKQMIWNRHWIILLA